MRRKPFQVAWPSYLLNTYLYIWRFYSGGHDLWTLCGHLQSLVLFDNHKWESACSYAAIGPGWWCFTCCSSYSLCSQLSLLWLSYHWPLHLWHVSIVKVCLHWHLHYWPHRLPMMGQSVWSSSWPYSSPMVWFCTSWRILWREAQNFILLWLYMHVAEIQLSGKVMSIMDAWSADVWQ